MADRKCHACNDTGWWAPAWEMGPDRPCPYGCQPPPSPAPKPEYAYVQGAYEFMVEKFLVRK